MFELVARRRAPFARPSCPEARGRRAWAAGVERAERATAATATKAVAVVEALAAARREEQGRGKVGAEDSPTREPIAKVPPIGPKRLGWRRGRRRLTEVAEPDTMVAMEAAVSSPCRR
jgi:hypothetical protein